MKVYSEDTIKNVRALRSQGLTYREINESLGTALPKSTLSYLCKGINLSDEYHERIKADTEKRLTYIRELAVKKNRQIFENKLQQINTHAVYASKLVRDPQVAKIALAMLYLGEGAKWKGRRGPLLGSSDPRIINIYIHLLYECYGVEKSTIRCRIQHRADQNSTDLLGYWSNITGIPKKHFYRSYVDKRTIGKVTKKTDYRGVCAISCPGTYIQLELDAIADMINVAWGISSAG